MRTWKAPKACSCHEDLDLFEQTSVKTNLLISSASSDRMCTRGYLFVELGVRQQNVPRTLFTLCIHVWWVGANIIDYLFVGIQMP